MDLTNYWLQLVWLFLFGGISLLFIPQREEIVLGEPQIRWGKLSAAVLAIPFVLWAAWRSNQFGDTGQYRLTFRSMPTGFSQMMPYIMSRSKGHGFIAFEYLFKTIISDSDVFFFFVIALIQMYFLVRTFRRYSCNYWLSMFLFVASTDYMSWMHNGIRQFLAVTIIFAALPLLIKHRYVLMFIIVFLSAQIHSSALFFLPFIFVVNGRAWNARTLLFILGLVLSILFLDRVTGIIAKTMEETTYEDSIALFMEDDGTNIVRVLFYSVPTIASWIFRDLIYAEDDPVINVCTNLSIVTAGVYLFSYFTSGILVGAIPIYFSLANYILFPWLIRKLFTRESAVFVQGVLMAVYTVFFYYQMGMTWHLL